MQFGSLALKHKCKCGKEYESDYALWGCPDCIAAFNTPEVIKAREEYQKTEAYTHGFHNDSGLIVPNDKFVDITPYGVTFKTKDQMQKQLQELDEEIQTLVERRNRIKDKIG